MCGHERRRPHPPPRAAGGDRGPAAPGRARWRHRSRCSSTTSGPPGCQGDLDNEANVGIRTGSDAGAAAGADAVLAEGREAIAALPGLLDSRREPDAVLIPWQGWALTTDDLLTTRMMETVVHSDDLAASVGLSTPTFPDAAVTPVLALLTGVAVRRHGQAALVRALSRPQRAPASVSAF